VATHGLGKQQVKPPKKTAAMLKRGSPSGTRVARSGPRKSQINAAKKNTVVVLTSAKVTSSGLRQQEIKPSRKVAYPGFDPRETEKLRRLSRREWLQLYYSAPPQSSVPKSRDELSPGRRRSFRQY
jgi:hypothetical protein